MRLMKCPNCGVNVLDHAEVCPYCKTPIPKETEEKQQSDYTAKNTGRFSSINSSSKDYDFDLQYTLTFRDAGEIKQAIADMDVNSPNESLKKRESTILKNDAPRYTVEEMQEAALRAQQRRERRNSGKSETKDGRSYARVTHYEKKRRSALRAAKEKTPPRTPSDRRVSSPKGLFLGAGVLVVVVAIIIGIVNICAYFAHSDPEFPTVYVRGNELYSYYDGKEELLSSNFITAAAEPDAENDENENEDDDNDSEEENKLSDPKIETLDVLTEKDLIYTSESGEVTFFMENMNMNTRAGNLVYYKNGSKKSRTVLAQNVYYDLEIGKDGTSVLYIKNADENGANGELCFWSPAKGESVSIEQNVNADNFKLSQDCTSVTYIRNFNTEEYWGDLCYLSFAENAGPTKRVDEKVSFIFGTTPNSTTYFYAKNYDKRTGKYDLYVQSDAEGPKAIAEKGYLPPVISQKNNIAFVYSNYNNNFQTISCVDLTLGENIELVKEATEIIKVRIDDGAIIYSKAYENEKADYYVVNSKSPNPQTVATAINTAAAKNIGIVSFDASDDFSRVAYIGGFDTSTMSGALYTLSVINDYAGSEMRISDAAYGCDVSSDGAVVRFATGYNTENNTVSLVSYLNSNTLALADGVGAGAFTFDKTGEYTIYAKNVDTTNVTGKIESVDKKARIKGLDEGVSAYGLKKDGTVLLLKKAEGSESTNLYKTKLKGGKPKLISENTDKVLKY